MKTSSVLALLLLALMASFVPGVSAQNEDVASSRKVLSRVTPQYPPIARTLNLKGFVRLEAVVAANGSVKSVQIVGGNPVLAQSAESAIHDWKWEKTDHETTERIQVQFNP